jgi:hypothetical protein
MSVKSKKPQAKQKPQQVILMLTQLQLDLQSELLEELTVGRFPRFKYLNFQSIHQSIHFHRY